jgi:hypothetical protein
MSLFPIGVNVWLAFQSVKVALGGPLHQAEALKESKPEVTGPPVTSGMRPQARPILEGIPEVWQVLRLTIRGRSQKIFRIVNYSLSLTQEVASVRLKLDSFR